MNESVKRAWHTNDQVNRVLIDHCTPDMLAAQMPGAAMSVALLFAHMSGSTKYWASRLDEERLADTEHLFHQTEAGEYIAEQDGAKIREAFTRIADAALAAVEAAGVGRGDLPHPDGEAMLLHMIVHDAHHRGQILLALKADGHQLPDEHAMWNPWKDASN